MKAMLTTLYRKFILNVYYWYLLNITDPLCITHLHQVSVTLRFVCGVFVAKISRMDVCVAPMYKFQFQSI